MVRYRATVAREFLDMGRFDLFETSGTPFLAGTGEGPPYLGAGSLVLRASADHRVHGGYGDSANATATVWYWDGNERYASHIEDDGAISFVPTDTTF